MNAGEPSVVIHDKEYMEKLGKALKELRLAKKLSQISLSRDGDVARICTERHLRSVENGEVMPTAHVLNQLLQVLGVDFGTFSALIYSEHLVKFMSDFEVLWKCLNEESFDTAQSLFIKIKEDYAPHINDFQVRQVLLLCDGILTKNIDKNLEKCQHVLIEALKMTMPTLVRKNAAIATARIPDIRLSKVEYRLLNAIATTKRNLGHPKSAIRILAALLTSLRKKCEDIEFKREIMPVIYFNLSNAHANEHYHEKSLSVSEQGIKFCVEYKSFKTLGRLHYNKGRALFYLGDKANAKKQFFLSYITFLSQENKSEARHVKAIAAKKYNFLLQEAS